MEAQLVLVFVAVLCAGTAAAEPTLRAALETLTPENGLDKGDWGPISLCPPGHISKSFEFKYESLGNFDDTAGNGIKIYCEAPTGGISYVTSSVGKYGDWRGVRSCNAGRSKLNGVHLEVLPYQGSFGDDMGVTNVQMFCSGDGKLLDGLKTSMQAQEQKMMPELLVSRRLVTMEDGRQVETMSVKVPHKMQKDNPSFGAWLMCKTGHSICGLQTRVEKESTFDDDNGMTDCIFYCC